MPESWVSYVHPARSLVAKRGNCTEPARDAFSGRGNKSFCECVILTCSLSRLLKGFTCLL